MTAIEFVKALRAYAPLFSAHQKPETTALYRAFRLPLKRRMPQQTEAPLIDLVTSYDIAALELGHLRLWGPETYGHRVVCGAFDLDHLYVDRPSGEVRIGTRQELALVRWRCAASQGEFLAAVAHVAFAYARAVIEGEQGCHPEVLGWSARVCANLAGARVYEAFYHALLAGFAVERAAVPRTWRMSPIAPCMARSWPFLSALAFASCPHPGGPLPG